MKVITPRTIKTQLIPLSTAHSKVNHFSDRLVLRDQSGIDIVPFEDIIRCEADGNYTIIIKTSGDKLIVSSTLKTVESRLIHGKFARPHQSHLIAIDQIRRIDYAKGIMLSDDTLIPISRRRKIKFMKDLNL